MGAFATIDEFTALQEQKQAQMVVIAERIKRIKNSLGKAILKRIEEATLYAVGLSLEVPQDLIYPSFGAIGLGLSIIEKIRLKPHVKELLELEKQYENAGAEYSKQLAIEAAKRGDVADELKSKGFTYNPISGVYDPPIKKIKVDSFTEQTGIPELLRNQNLNPNLAYLVYPIGGYLGYKLFKKIKRKKRK